MLVQPAQCAGQPTRVMPVITWHVRMDLPVLYAFDLICVSARGRVFLFSGARISSCPNAAHVFIRQREGSECVCIS